jgi:hypothetical protein
MSREQYIGSVHDLTFLNKSPIKDIIQWDRKIAHMGYLPYTFKDFLNITVIIAILSMRSMSACVLFKVILLWCELT